MISFENFYLSLSFNILSLIISVYWIIRIARYREAAITRFVFIASILVNILAQLYCFIVICLAATKCDGPRIKEALESSAVPGNWVLLTICLISSQVLELFRVLSGRITELRLRYWNIMISLTFLITNFGLWADTIYSIIWMTKFSVLYSIVGSLVFGSFVFIYTSVQSLWLIRLIVKWHAKNNRAALVKAAYRKLLFYICLGIFVDLLLGVVQVANILYPGSLYNGLNAVVIGGIGIWQSLFILLFLQIKSLALVTNQSSRMRSKDQKEVANREIPKTVPMLDDLSSMVGQKSIIKTKSLLDWRRDG